MLEFAVFNKEVVYCNTKRSSLNLLVFVALVVFCVNTFCIVTLVCNDGNNTCLGCDGFFKHVALPWKYFVKQPPAGTRTKDLLPRNIEPTRVNVSAWREALIIRKNTSIFVCKTQFWSAAIGGVRHGVQANQRIS